MPNKILLIDLPPEKLNGPGEATLKFIGVGETDPEIKVFKLRLDHGSTYIHFYDRESGFSWESPNQSPLSAAIVDPNGERPHVIVTDTLGLCEVTTVKNAKLNRCSLVFPAIYNWIQVGNWAIPIP